MNRSTSLSAQRQPAAPILRGLTVGLVLGMMGLAPRTALASESHCYSIRDADRKNVCLAMAKQQASYCYSVRDADDKNLCLAQVKSQRSYCYSIRTADQKNQCLAMVR